MVMERCDVAYDASRRKRDDRPDQVLEFAPSPGLQSIAERFSSAPEGYRFYCYDRSEYGCAKENEAILRERGDEQRHNK